MISEDHEFITIYCECCGHTFDVPVYCGNRFCQVCNKPRLSRIRNRLDFLIHQVKQLPGMRLKHLTLTLPNQPDLPSMLKHLVKSFRKLRQSVWWKNHVSGGAFVLEVTGREGDWHGHIHTVLMGAYFVWETLRNLWIRFSGGRGVWVNAIPQTEVVKYLTKYLTKPDLPETALALVNQSLKGYRMFQPYGSWYAFNNLYVKPKPICPKCQKIDTFGLYYEYFGGSIRHWGTSDVDTRKPRSSPQIDWVTPGQVLDPVAASVDVAPF